MTFSENNTSAALDFESAPPLPPRPKLRRYLLLLVFLGLVLYLFLPRISAMQHELVVLASLRIPFVMLAVAAQIISYLGSGYLLRAVVNLSPRPVSVMDGALVTLGANSVGTLGGGALGTAGMTYFWLRRRGANRGAAGLGGWIPIFLNLAVALIEGEVVPQQRLAEALHPNEAAVVLGLVGHDGTPFLALGPL